MGIKDLGLKKTDLASNFEITSSRALKHSPMLKKVRNFALVCKPRTTGPLLVPVPKSQP